jgi:hypothetical protein
MRPNPMAEGQRVILSLRQQVERALYLSNRALGRAPKVIEGERVRVKPHARWAGLVDDEYTIAEVVGKDETAMCRLRGRNGGYIKWFRAATDLEPAQPTEVSMNTNIEQRAARFEARVAQHFTNTGDWMKAFNLAQIEDRTGAEIYRARGVGATVMEAEPAPVVSLSARTGESFDALAMEYAHEHSVPLRKAVHEVAVARPDLAAARD